MQHKDAKKQILAGLILDMKGAEKDQLKSRKKPPMAPPAEPPMDDDEDDKSIGKPAFGMMPPKGKK